MHSSRPDDITPARQPVWLNLLAIRQPLPGWLSIVQRTSGVLLALAFPLFVRLLQVSLSPDAVRLRVWAHALPGRIVLTGLTWLLAQHALGGVRFLLLEKGIATNLNQARWLSGAVFGASFLVALAVLTGGW